jgi:histone chaperone ASF1
VRVGYYVNNEYDSDELRESPPETPQPERVLRTILADKPRVTRFPIRWDDILDETAKKPEDEEIDKDADFRGGAPQPDANQGGQEDEDDDDEGSEEEESEDEFTSQLGPEEQDRMSMMIDEDQLMDDGALDENVSVDPNFLHQAACLKPSPLAMATSLNEDSSMML